MKNKRNCLVLTGVISAQLLSPVHAGISLDGTLGAAGDLSPDADKHYTIGASLGRQAGANLFHSFGDFNINTGESATFTGPETTANIISRVTGGKPSVIDGALRCEIPKADLYLLNPAGVMVNEHATVDIQGSLHLSSADYLLFEDGQRFNAKPAAPSALSIAKPEAFGFLTSDPGSISIDGAEDLGVMQKNQNISLTGGDVQVLFANLITAGGDIRITSAASAGEINRSDPNNHNLTALGEVTLEASRLIAGAPGDETGGSVLIQGGEFFMRFGSSIQTRGIDGTGDVKITAAGRLHVTDNSQIKTFTVRGDAGSTLLQGGQVEISAGSVVSNMTEGAGQGGSLRVEAQNFLVVTDRETQIITSASGTGKGGDLSLHAANINLLENAVISAETHAQGPGGKLSVDTGSLEISGGAEVVTLVWDDGRQAGDVNIRAGGSVSITGYSSEKERGSQAASRSFNEAGRTGNVTLVAGQLSVADRGRIISDAKADTGAVALGVSGGLTVTGGSLIGTKTVDGQAGPVNLNAGRLAISTTNSAASSLAEGIGQAGMVRVEAGSLVSLSGGGQISNEAFVTARAGPLLVISPVLEVTGGGKINSKNGGSIGIMTETLRITTGSQVTYDSSRPGEVSVEARDVLIANNNSKLAYQSSGNGGGITVSADTVALRDGGAISSQGPSARLNVNGRESLQLTNGAGIGNNGGSVALNTPLLEIENSTVLGKKQSSGANGDIVIETGVLALKNGAGIGIENYSSGQGGTVKIHAAEAISIAGRNARGEAAKIVNQVRNTGNGGTVALVSPAVRMADGGVIEANTQGLGQAGNIQIQTDELSLVSGARVRSNSLSAGNGGEIDIQAARSVSLAGELSALQASAGKSGNGGGISIHTPHLQITGNSALLAEATAGSTGRAGDIALDVNKLELTDGARISTNSVGRGHGGRIDVIASESVRIAGAKIHSDTFAQGKGGNIVLSAPDLSITGGRIQTISEGQGDAGSIRLILDRLLLADGAQVNASTLAEGRGGEIDVSVTAAADIFGEQAQSLSGLSSSTWGEGDGGMVRISAQVLNLDKRGTLQTLARGNGNAGDIAVNVRDLRISEGGDIDASNEGTGHGKGGDITIHAAGAVSISAEQVDQAFFKFLGGVYSYAENAGAGGNVLMNAGQLTLTEGGIISGESTGTGNAGNLTIHVNGPLLMEDAGITTRATGAGGGVIHVDTPARMHLLNSEITARAEGLERHHGGGNVTIDGQEFIIVDKSLVLASAVGGDGGNIDITAAQFLMSGNSALNASSELGVDGTVRVNAPDADISGSLIIPANFLNISAMVNEQCAVRTGASMSRFVVLGKEAFPASPEDLQTSVEPEDKQ
ncbi:MAG: filamentous hemagglutinin N-terminal domain-containing protein [Gammaproteobacteria bacterium]|nr:filamentous hemagglutinin N-terminal domain-containing protein [Gammaproteobacteria bacterium]